MNIETMLPIESKRLFIGRFKSSDWESFYQIEKSPQQHRFNSDTYNPRSETQVQDYINELSNQDYANCHLPFRLAIRLKHDRALIGYAGLKNGTLKKDGTAEVFYSIYHEFWNKGYGTEALQLMIEFGFDQLGLHRIFAGCDIDNYASKRVMEKAGMHFESMWRKDRKRNGQWTDGIGFSIIREDANKKK